MLDYRTSGADPLIERFLARSAEDNETACDAILGEHRGTDGVPETAAPTRMTDAKGLPKVYIEFGELDLF